MQFGIILNIWLLVQMVVLLSQSHFGARFFIPSTFLPKKYNYHRVLHANRHYNNNTHQSPEENNDGTSSFFSKLFRGGVRNKKLKYDRVVDNSNDEEESVGEVVDCVICVCEVDQSRPALYMLTPCDHIFHTQCLEQWMQVKMECPTCRTQLPTV